MIKSRRGCILKANHVHSNCLYATRLNSFGMSRPAHSRYHPIQVRCVILLKMPSVFLTIIFHSLLCVQSLDLANSFFCGASYNARIKYGVCLCVLFCYFCCCCIWLFGYGCYSNIVACRQLMASVLLKIFIRST